VRSAHDWLAEADFDSLNEEQFQAFVAVVGYDKACECRAAMKRISENMLDALGGLRMSEESMGRLLAAVSSVAIDNTFPRERS
jgi:hypothetical protein